MTPSPPRPRHAVELLGRDITQPQRLLAQSRTLGVRRLGDLRRLVVADLRRERGDEYQRLLHQRSDPRGVGANADHAARLQHRIDDHRLNTFSSKWPWLAATLTVV